MSEQPDLAGLLDGGAVPLMQASTPTEARLIRERIAAAGGSAAPLVSLGPPGDLDAELPAEVTGRGDDTTLVPLRVAWLPEEHAGRRAARLADLVPGRDPYHPSEHQQRRILARQPGRAVVLAGEPATIGSLRHRWTEASGGDDPDDYSAGLWGDDPPGTPRNDFGAYVARRATLALDRAEYRLRGPRYKTPSLVKEEILASRRFRAGLRGVRHGSGDDPPSLEQAGEILDELAAGWSRRFIDVCPPSAG